MCFYSLSYAQEERVLIICGKAVLTPSDGTDSVTISAGDFVKFHKGFSCRCVCWYYILLQQTIPARDLSLSLSLSLSLCVCVCVCVSVCVYYIDTWIDSFCKCDSIQGGMCWPPWRSTTATLMKMAMKQSVLVRSQPNTIEMLSKIYHCRSRWQRQKRM